MSLAPDKPEFTYALLTLVRNGLSKYLSSSQVHARAAMVCNGDGNSP